MIRIEDLYKVYLIARSNKRRKNDAVSFEFNLERNLTELCEAINNRTYRAFSNYTFVVTHPRPREVFAAEIQLRIIHTYIDWRLRPLMESELTERTFNNRKGYGTDRAINQVIEDVYDVSKGFTKDAWIIKWDLTGYFPNANCDIVYRQFIDLVQRRYDGDDKEDLLWMLMICVYSDPARHCYRKSPISAWDDIEPSKSLFNKPFGIGGAIGFLLWQNAMNYYLNDIDHWAVDTLGLHYTRFVDDTVIVVNNKEAALSLIPLFRERYNRLGVEMHKRKFYCQHYTKGVEFIGSHIKMDRIYLNNRIISRAKRKVAIMNSWSEKRKYFNIEEFISIINCYLGMMKRRNEYRNSVKILSMIDDSWYKFIKKDVDNMKVVAKKAYNHRNLLKYKHNLKFKKI